MRFEGPVVTPIDAGSTVANVRTAHPHLHTLTLQGHRWSTTRDVGDTNDVCHVGVDIRKFVTTTTMEKDNHREGGHMR